MSKTTKTTQLGSGPKITTGVTARKSTSNTVSKPSNGVTKVSTQAKATLSTSRSIDEKEKSKTSSTSTLRRTEPNANLRARTQTTQRAAASTKSTKTTAAKASATTAHTATVKQRSVKQNATAKPQQGRAPPMRAKQSVAVDELAKRNHNSNSNTQKKTTTANTKTNPVLDTYHNVTVASPPPTRRKSTNITSQQAPQLPTSQAQSSETTQDEQLPRSGTGTLEEEEIVVLRTDSAKKRIEQQILADMANTPTVTVKEPIAFEVNFDERAKTTTKSREPSRTRHKANAHSTAAVLEDEQNNYSDDFESYESDFETGSSSQNASSTETENSNDESAPASLAIGSADSSDEAQDVVSDEEDEESELTQYPITVIQREKEHERKLDSGNYEMHSRRQPKLSELSTQSSQQQFDSLDTSYSVAASEQLDSGISSYGNGNVSGTQSETNKLNNVAIVYGGYAHFNTRPVLSKRGKELMSKIQFDTLTFTLLDVKPISYEIYMRTYGKLNTTQTATQTNENRVSSECQTDDYELRTMWTQHPPQYDLQTIQKLTGGLSGAAAVQNCCGEQTPDALPTTAAVRDEYDASLVQLAHLRQTNNSRAFDLQLKRLQKPLDFERLNSFLLSASMLMSKVLNTAQAHSPNERHPELQHASTLQSISEGHFELDTRFLNALRVVRIFANPKHNLVITVHECLPDADVYRSDFSNLLMVWSTSERKKPIRLLSTWSEVCRAEICNDFSNIIVCGLRDGSVAMWDLRETYSFCSKLDGYLTHFAATQSILPTFSVGEQNKQLLDLGAVVDVKSFRAPPKALGFANTLTGYKSIQFATLNDTGIMTIWTLVETNTKHYELSTPSSTQNQRRARNSPANHNTRFEYSSPWARVKLIQSAICDLREYLERGQLKLQSQFDKTKSLFQRNIYSDEALRELTAPNAETQPQQQQCLQGLRFTSIDTGCERIYVCTNRNFILACSKSLKTERFRKIALNNSRFLFPTALRVLTNEDFLAVGLSNGSVMIVNCSQHKALQRAQSARATATTAPGIGDKAIADTPDFSPETGKSCAIQNIILNERRGYESENVLEQDTFELRPNTAACIAMITNQQRPFELRVYDQQLLLSGTALRKHLVQSLELSSDGWRLFALSNGEVRTYDFYLDRELANEHSAAERQRVADIAVARTAQSEQHLVVLNANCGVEVHLLKQ